MIGPVTTVVDAEVEGTLTDVRLVGDRIDQIGPSLPRAGSEVVQAAGGALLPGLHDHHLHLFAMAARDRSLDVAAVEGADGFDRAVRDAHAAGHPTAWLRVVGYDESHGPLDAERLAALAPDRPVRVQHRTGAAWMLSPAAGRATGVAADGWQHREDERLAAAWDDGAPPDLRAVAARLAAAGVTGVTDATPFTTPEGYAALAAARTAGDLPQRVVVTGGPDLATTAAPDGLDLGPVKVVVADHELPDPDDLAAQFALAHRAGRPVAVHCVTRVATVLAVVAWELAGAVDGDRVEHASVVPVELVGRLAALGVQVVTQPAFVRAHGDRYLRTVEADDLPHLYRCASLLEAGIGVGGSTDAPFGPEDPWVAVAAAADRRTAGGAVLGADERVAAEVALGGFLSRPERPGGPARQVVPGAAADLVLLDGPLATVLASPGSDHVAATWIGGRCVHRRI